MQQQYENIWERIMSNWIFHFVFAALFYHHYNTYTKIPTYIFMISL